MSLRKNKKGGGNGGDEGGKKEKDENSGPTNHWAAARAKMDVSRALAIMGFSSSRTLDTDARNELNTALSKQMEIIGELLVNLQERKSKDRNFLISC